MRDYFSENFEWDEHGNKRRKKRVLGDRERLHVPMQFMDHAAFGFRTHFADGSPDHTNPHRPGFRFLDVNDETQIAADAAYEEMRARLHYGHRQRQQDGASDHGSPQPTPDELEQAAVTAYEVRSERMRNAWKTRHA